MNFVLSKWNCCLISWKVRGLPRGLIFWTMSTTSGQKPTMFLRLDRFLFFQWMVVVRDPSLVCPLQTDVCDTPSRTGTPSFCLSTGRERHIQSPKHCVFFFGPEVMTRYQKISHIDYNITLSKPFKFEDVYHLKISQSSAHYWKEIT